MLLENSMGKVLTLLLVLFLSETIFATLPLTVHASSRTIVVPDNFATIEAAIGYANDGDTILVKSGTYDEKPINTTKSLILVGASSQSTFLNITSSATVENFYGFNITTFGRAIEVNANNFTLSGFKIQTNGGDISFYGNYSTITDNQIAAPFSAKGGYLNISHNTFLRAHFSSGWGINFNYNLDVFLSLSNFSNNFVSYDNNMCSMTINGYYNVISNNSISGTYLGIGTTPCFLSGNKITWVLSSFSIASRNSIITKNMVDTVAYGLGDDGSNNVIFANQVTNCDEPYGDPFEHFPLANADDNESSLFYCNNFINSSVPVHGVYSNKIDSFDNGTLGNYWSDYKGTDSDHDGIGDTPYKLLTANGTDFHPLMAPFGVSAAPDLMPNWAKDLASSVIGMSDNGSAFALTLDGNITSSQMSNIKISENGTMETISFTVIGHDNSAGFSNVTIPANIVSFGATPHVYIDGQSDSSQGYTFDNTNYHVWYTIHFSKHDLSVIFSSEKTGSTFPTLPIIVVLVAAVFVVAVVVVVYMTKRRRENG